MSDKSSMLEQLGLLRNLLLRALGVTVFIFACLAFFQDSIYLSISEPLIRFLPDNSSMIATEVTSPFLTPLKLTFYMAIFVAIPYLMFELWKFVSPGLFKTEKIYTISLTSLSTVLFYLGTFFAFFVVFPLIFSFFINSAPEGVAVMTDISSYLNFVIKLLVAFGLAFQMPIVIFTLVKSEIASIEVLSNARPYIIIGCFIFGMLLTPPDIISQTLLAVPTWTLFELGLLGARLIKT
jgi:sec-independent protein translocase protein TatC